ncbi:MAG: TatD family nuclease-associated radical SAM protein [Clostridia bacterium]
MNNFVYTIGTKLYINLTNKCSNNCDFCIRKTHDGMEGQPLWLEDTPEATDIADQLPENLDEYDNEVVFCGFGEPTFNFDVMCDIADFLHTVGKTTRVNTNGQGNLICNRDITEDIVACIDVINVSLNASNAKSYQTVCHSRYGEEAFDEMINFAVSCKKRGAKVVFSVVDSIGAKEINACQRLADKNNIPLRVREKK